MESRDEDFKDGSTNKKEEDCNGIQWANIRHFQHRYLINIPTKLENHLPINIELPIPLFNPSSVTSYNEYQKLFHSKPKVDTRLAYYRKLYSKTNKKMFKQTIQENEFTSLPQYIVDVAQGVFENCEDEAWSYTGGTLELFSYNNDEYLVKAGFKQSVQVININEPDLNVHIKLHENTPVYNIKSIVSNDCTCLAVRQKCRISLLNLSDNLQSNLVWKIKTVSSSFVDMVFNKIKENELAVIDANHKLKLKDYNTKSSVATYDFLTNFSNVSDHLAQINYIDCNTISCINRCCVYLLDLRSLSTQKTCLKTTWLKCDDLCTFSQNANTLYVSSLHNIISYDVRSMKVLDRALHMLPTSPFITTSISNSEGDIVCLSGQRCNDKALLYSANDLLSTPHYIPNTKDAFVKASLTKMADISEHIEQRLSLPSIGMKLYRSSDSADINLYTLNSVGDVFKQNILQNEFGNTEAINKLVEWSNKISYKPKVLEASSICNLSNIMHSVSHRFPHESKLRSLMKENTMLQLFEKEYLGLTKCIEGNVGASMNAIWDDEKPVGEENADLTSEISSKHKVSEWLDSVN